MTNEAAEKAAMDLLIVNVGYTMSNLPEPHRALLRSDLAAALAAIGRSGIDLDAGKPEDVNLLVAYASWLFTKRRTGEAKPPMLTTEIRDRQVARATGARAEADA